MISKVQSRTGRSGTFSHPGAEAEFLSDLFHGEVLRQDFSIDATQLLVSRNLYNAPEQFHAQTLVLTRIRYQYGNLPLVPGVGFDQPADPENAVLPGLYVLVFRDNRHLAVVIHETNAHQPIVRHPRTQAE